jgi:hypothetical protein
MRRRAIRLGSGLTALVVLAWGIGASGQTGRPGQAVPMPASAAPPTGKDALVENLTRFEPRDVRVVWNNRHWQLLHQGAVLKDFGFREQDARQALRVILDLKLNEHGTVGSPQPVMEYWLSDGKAPQALALGGLRTLALDEARLRVEQVNGQWCVGDGSRVLYTFGAQADAARQAAAVMRKYHFSQAAVLGQAGPSMVIFLGRPEGEAPPLTPPGRAGGGRQINVPRFNRLARDADGKPRRQAPGSPASPVAGLVSPALPAASAAVGQPTQPPRAEPHWHMTPAGVTPPSAVDPAADRVQFDWRQVQLRQGPSGEWRLAAGSLVLANFGTNVHEARLALSALRYYRFTEQLRVGGAQPVLTCCVAGPAAPRGLMMGLSGQAFQPDKLEVREMDGRCCLCSGQQVVLRLGDRSDEAARVLDRIKQSHVDRLCRVGDAGKEGMTMLLRSR